MRRVAGCRRWVRDLHRRARVGPCRARGVVLSHHHFGRSHMSDWCYKYCMPDLGKPHSLDSQDWVAHSSDASHVGCLHEVHSSCPSVHRLVGSCSCSFPSLWEVHDTLDRYTAHSSLKHVPFSVCWGNWLLPCHLMDRGHKKCGWDALLTGVNAL